MVREAFSGYVGMGAGNLGCLYLTFALTNWGGIMAKHNGCVLSSNVSRMVAISTGHFLNDFYMNLIPPILFVFAASLSLNMGQQGFIAFIIQSCGSFAQPLIGHMCDKKGKPVLLVYALLWIAFWMCIAGFITNYFLMAIAAGLGALASALYHPLGSAVTIRLLKRAQNTSLSLFMTIGGLAASVAPLVTLPVVNRYGLGGLIYFVVPGILMALLMAATRLDRMKAISNRASTVVPPVTAGQARPEKINLYSAKWLTVLVSAAAIRVWISRGFIVFGAQFFQLKDVSLAMAGSVLTLFLLATALGTFFGGIITDMIGTKKMMVISFVLASVCTLMMLMGKGYLTVIAFLLVGFFISTSNSSNIVIAHDIMPGNVTFATGMIMGLAGGVGGIGIYITGTMADSVGLIKATAFLMVPLLLMSVLNFLLPQTASSKNIKEVDVI